MTAAASLASPVSYGSDVSLVTLSHQPPTAVLSFLFFAAHDWHDLFMAARLVILLISLTLALASWFLFLRRRFPRGVWWGLGVIVAAVAVTALALNEVGRRKAQAAEAARRDAERREVERVARLTPEQLARERLDRLRRAVSAYRTDHRTDRFAAFGGLEGPSRLSFWQNLARESYVNRPIVGYGPVGPYLSQPLENPLTRSSTIAEPGRAKADDGWEYDQRTGDVWPVGLPRPRPEPRATTRPTSQP